MNIQEVSNLNIFEFFDLIVIVISKKFSEQFPEYFIRCKTLDITIHNTANKSGYSYVITILNAIKHGRFENSYKIDDYYETLGINVFEERQRLLNDIKNCTDIRIWCFNNIEI